MGIDTNNVDVQMVKGRFYKMLIDYTDWGVNALIHFYWAYAGVPKMIVPSESFFYPEYVKSSPYTVALSCPYGYSGTQASSPDRCVDVCGNGVKTTSEQCDDGNTADDDGCKSD